jgi:hypothetical protein
MPKPTVAEIFSGAGLFGAAFKEAGFGTVYAAELDYRAVKSFNTNVAAVAEVRDARDVRGDVRCDLLLIPNASSMPPWILIPKSFGFSSAAAFMAHDRSLETEILLAGAA